MQFEQLRRTFAVKLGATEDDGGDHVYYFLTMDGRDHRIGKVSHSSRGSDAVPDHVVTDTAHRLRLTKKELAQLVECSLDRQGFEASWRSRPPYGT